METQAQTPSFLLWSIEFGCSVRGFEDGTIPERVERQLRAARVYSEAERDGRLFEGLALDPPNGFRVEDALGIYGGVARARQCCRGCPANALADSEGAFLAGCYGYVPLPADLGGFYAAVDAAVERTLVGRLAPDDWNEGPPHWFALWAKPLWAEKLLSVQRVLQEIEIDEPACRSAIEQLRQGLDAAYHANRTLHARVFPGGRVENGNWRLAAHCPRCKANWGEPTSRQCGVCGYVGSPAPDKKRLARGNRPYFPLTRLLGNEAAEQLLIRYAEHQARRSSPDRR
ncbi:MAG: hypothetical protein SFU86_25815 [Pirellulaceae bacterium]|nr:hypothetical protein [Pirellulaceae bacterium]